MSRIRANTITNKAATGAPTFSNGAVVTGVCTATSFVGSGAKIMTASYGVTILGNARACTGGDGYTFITDPDTGMHNPSDGNLRLRVNGIDRLSMHTSGISTFHNQKIHIEGAGSGNTPLTINTDVGSNNSVHPLIEAYSDNATYKTQIGLVREGSSGALGWGFFTNASGSPQERLRIASDGTLTYRTGGGKGYDFNSSGSSAGIANMFAPASYTLAFGTNNTERLRITSTGLVQVGKDNQSSTTHNLLFHIPDHG